MFYTHPTKPGPSSPIRLIAVLLTMLASGAGHAPALGQETSQRTEAPPMPPSRPQTPGVPASAGVPEGLSHIAAPECLARLADLGVEIDSKRIVPAPENTACLITGPVGVVSIRNPSNPAQTVRLPDRPLLACAMAEKLAQYIFATLNPVARETVGADIASIGTGPGYECRPRNRQQGAPMSTHGQGLAIDIMHAEFSAAKKLLIAAPDGEGQQAFLKKLLETACATFNTVLGPDADGFHRDNIHIDLQARGLNGNVKYCR